MIYVDPLQAAHPQQIITSSANQSPSTSPIRRRVAQIPLVPTQIVLTTYDDDLSPIISRQAENLENSTETLETTQINDPTNSIIHADLTSSYIPMISKYASETHDNLLEQIEKIIAASDPFLRTTSEFPLFCQFPSIRRIRFHRFELSHQTKGSDLSFSELVARPLSWFLGLLPVAFTTLPSRYPLVPVKIRFWHEIGNLLTQHPALQLPLLAPQHDHEVPVRQLCGQPQQIITSSANQSPSSSPIRRRVAQIPLVPIQIVLTTYDDDLSPIISRQAENLENSTETLETTQINVSCIKDYHCHLVIDGHIFTQLFGLAY
ncbi:hypothetical protein Aperf_G00000120246 [Anoplocephala perfoliata]